MFRMICRSESYASHSQVPPIQWSYCVDIVDCGVESSEKHYILGQIEDILKDGCRFKDIDPGTRSLAGAMPAEQSSSSDCQYAIHGLYSHSEYL